MGYGVVGLISHTIKFSRRGRVNRTGFLGGFYT
jgi:hypothetical protein